MNPNDARSIIRDKGLCGFLLDGQVCILPIGHDDNRHERGWVIRTVVEPDPCARDSRETSTYYDATNGHKTFRTHNREWANWLVATLTAAETLK